MRTKRIFKTTKNLLNIFLLSSLTVTSRSTFYLSPCGGFLIKFLSILNKFNIIDKEYRLNNREEYLCIIL